MNTELYHEHLEDLYQKFGNDTRTISLAQAAEWINAEPEALKEVKGLVMQVGKRYKVPLRNLARLMACGR